MVDSKEGALLNNESFRLQYYMFEVISINLFGVLFSLREKGREGGE